jgi:sugar phosphate isomerase/epimerase
MKLSISNIAWDKHNDFEVYELMKKYGFTGLEIAPTRFFAEKPYDHIVEAANLANDLKSRYNLKVCSMQSILFERTERIFENAENRRIITDYLFKAIDFASAISCKNLVFGSPKNRNLINQGDYEMALRFFEILGEYAAKNGTVMSIEANPVIYGTNFINYTSEAVKLVKEVNSKGLRINLDFGTIIENGEKVEEVEGFLEYVNHIHISEPGLLPICRRDEHKRLAAILKQNSYEGYISIEMKKGEDGNLQDIEKAMNYICEVFGN